MEKCFECFHNVHIFKFYYMVLPFHLFAYLLHFFAWGYEYMIILYLAFQVIVAQVIQILL